MEIREYFPGNLCARQPDGSVLVGDETLLAFKSLMFDFTDMYKAVAEAGSPGLQKVREIFLEQGTAYAVCELYDLPTLAQYVRENGALSVMEAKRIMLELCSALTPIHRGGLIHGAASVPAISWWMRSPASGSPDFPPCPCAPGEAASNASCIPASRRRNSMRPTAGRAAGPMSMASVRWPITCLPGGTCLLPGNAGPGRPAGSPGTARLAGEYGSHH